MQPHSRHALTLSQATTAVTRLLSQINRHSLNCTFSHTTVTQLYPHTYAQTRTHSHYEHRLRTHTHTLTLVLS